MVCEDADAFGLADCRGEAAHCLTHHARLQAHGSVAHLAFKLLTRNERGDGVYHNDVDCARTDKGFGDVEGVLSAFGLGNHEVFEVDADDFRVLGVESVLDVDEHRVAAPSLRLRYERKTESGFSRRFGPVNFDDSAARKPADAKREVYRYRARAYGFDIHLERFAEPDERAFPELLVYHAQGGFESLVVLVYNSYWYFLFCHNVINPAKIKGAKP